ncbi:hypothetical protein GCM10010449_66550 [Streptomyces rectiviolaceus]|uniref:Lipoprotein n=1 Tax=Streptomyces rectiviolaceus TaxID=332591 RepID=A0ABP6N6Y3_9ACTN
MLYAVGFAGAAVIGVAACDPVDGGMNTAAVAITTDEMATKELERQHLDVLWISCTARFKDKATPSSGDPSRDSVATVDCQGQARKGKGSDDTSEITVKGTVTSVVDGHCVRGNLTAKVDGKEWFRVDVIGDCSGGDDGNGNGNGNSNGNGNGGDDGGDHDGDKPTQPPAATVTVTATPDPPPRQPDPTCSCFKGK